MFKHIRFKIISFYGFSIVFVLVLFKIVTTYGEANLKAAPAIGGHYSIVTDNLPPCPNSHKLTLIIEQSGVYLSGSLSANENGTIPAKIAERKPFLSGKWHDEELNLLGNISQSKLCGIPANQTGVDEIHNVNIQAKLAGETLQGKLNFNPSDQPVEFVAKREESIEKSQEKH